MYDREQNYSEKTLKREKKIYKKLLAIYNALLFAADEGVYEVTIRSQAGAIVVPVSLNDGCEITHLVVENFGARLSRLEANFKASLENAGVEATTVRESEEKATAEREVTSRQARLDYAAQGLAIDAELAAGAAALLRERVTPVCEVLAQVVQLAATTPMNATATAPTAQTKGGAKA